MFFKANTKPFTGTAQSLQMPWISHLSELGQKDSMCPCCTEFRGVPLQLSTFQNLGFARLLPPLLYHALSSVLRPTQKQRATDVVPVVEARQLL